MYDVREAADADVAPVQRVDASLEQRETAPEIVRKAIDEGKLLVALDGDEVIGYVRWDNFWDQIPLCVLVRVTPAHQRRGAGRALYRALEERLRAAGRTFWLSSLEEDNERSRLFHESLGFRRIGALEGLNENGVREVFYRKDLA